MTTVYIPAGAFIMGSDDEQVDYAVEHCVEDEPGYQCQRAWFLNEQPSRLIYLTSYWIDRTEVTNDAFVSFLKEMGATGGQPEGVPLIWIGDSRIEYEGGEWRVEPAYGSHPATGVSWLGAQEYCEWAGRRLPAEAEWEKAARGTDGRVFPWGNDDPTCLLANYGGCIGDTTPVGSYPEGASPYGAMDMAGNVWEWVHDWYQDYYYSMMPSADPVGPVSGSQRVLRGGWAFGDPRDTESVRTTVRYANLPENAATAWGFRCAGSP